MSDLSVAEPVHVTSGALTVRLAKTKEEIEAAQYLRYRVFFDEMGAHPTEENKKYGRDFDSFDPFCDHLIVVDASPSAANQGIVATYRLMRRAAAKKEDVFILSMNMILPPFSNFRVKYWSLGVPVSIRPTGLNQ